MTQTKQTCTRAEATKRLTNRWNEQVKLFPLMRKDIPLALYIRANIWHVMRNNTLASYSTMTLEEYTATMPTQRQYENKAKGIYDCVPLKPFYASLCIKDGGGYVTIYANDMNEARNKMFASKYGKEWAFMYDASQKAEALDAFGQIEVDTIA